MTDLVPRPAVAEPVVATPVAPGPVTGLVPRPAEQELGARRRVPVVKRETAAPAQFVGQRSDVQRPLQTQDSVADPPECAEGLGTR